MRFSPGDEILVVGGRWSGYTGTVLHCEDWVGGYLVQLNTKKAKDSVLVPESQVDSAQYEQPEEEDEIIVPTFPASAEDIQAHLEWMLERVLGKVGQVGPEQALFGFQEFEGKTPSQVLLALMEKLEEGMALFGQAHILLGRIVVALETMNDQE